MLFESVPREFLLAKDGLYTARGKGKMAPQYTSVFVCGDTGGSAEVSERAKRPYLSKCLFVRKISSTY